MPATSTFAALVLVALIPGYLYLRLTETARHPRNHSDLGEFLEVLSVGVATTGLALGALLLACPRYVAEALTGMSLHDPDGLRGSIGVLLGIGGLALLLAWLGAWATRKIRPNAYSHNVWRATLDTWRHKQKHLPYVVLELRDRAERVEGVLHAYTTLDGDHPRDVALTKPRLRRGSDVWDVGADYVVINAEEIQAIWLTLTPDPGTPSQAP